MKNIIIILIFTFCLPSYAEITEASKTDIILSDLGSPFTTNAKYIFIGGSLITAFVALNKEDFSEKAANRVTHDPPLGNYGYIGEALGWGYLNAIYSLSYLTHGYLYGKNRSLERAEMMIDASFYTLLTTASIKTAVKAQRPEYPEENDSFPSGHASMSFAFASIVTAEHGLYWGLPAYAVASFISLSRINDGRHWTHDVLAGATIGASYGWGVYLNHRKKKSPFFLTIIPSVDLKSATLMTSYRF
ncbi:phosphatase PAP2 family protein [Halobacteriovorax sp. HLS]|uniref:phosphatase PAP2 family protein n=1 Tax=Halobacteriovorax sp. HLS TaxID=2234000 RepID=UPI0013E3DBE5|nr:phosphatase PAP2 family protein [Halobacteriovorax sp. HLS]